MDLSKSLPLKKRQNFEIQQPWVPTTPAKTTPASTQRSQPPGPSWLEPAVSVANGAQETAALWGRASQLGSSSSSGLPNHLQDARNSHASALAASGHATTGSIVMLQAPATSSSNVHSLECWSPLLYGNVNAACNVTGTSKVPPCSPLLVQIGNRQEMSATQNMLLLKREAILPASFSNTRCCCSGHKAEYSLPVTSFANYDSLPESTMSVSKTVTMSAPPTPATTEKFYKVMQDKQPSSEVTELVGEGAREENLMAKEVGSSQPTLERLVSGKDIIVLSEEAIEKPIGVQKSSIEKKNSGIDLNVETPKKRLQRKKHRPKVFKEGKPSRTPKPETPQLETDEQSGWKESTSCKRKYVRRKKDVTHSSETASNALGEIIDAESKGEAKSVRRCLNFDLEEQQEFDEFSDAMSMFKKVLGARVLEVRNESAVTSSSMKETTDPIRMQYQVAVKPSAGTVSDLNISTCNSQNECSKLLQIPVLPAEINKNLCSSIKQMPYLKSSVKHFKALARETACLDSAAVNSQNSSKVGQRNLNPNRISDAPPKGTKRVNLSFDEAVVSDQKRIMHSYNLRGCSSKSYVAGRKDSCPMRIHKRIRMEKWGHNEANPNVSPKFICTASNSWKIKQLSNSSPDLTFADAPRFMAQKKVQDLERVFSFDQTEGYVQSNPASGTEEASLSSTRSSSRNLPPVKPSKQKNKDIIQPSTPKKLSKFRDTLENKICGNQAHLEISEGIMKPLKASTKTSTMKQDHGHQLNLVSSSTKHTFLEEREAEPSNDISPAQNIVEGGALATKCLHWMKLNPEAFSVNSQSTCYYNVSAPSSLSLGTLVPFKNPMDDVIRKLRRLSISCNEVSSSQAQNSIVPYVGHGGMMVTYERNVHLIKRQRPRAKVDLDPESSRVWNLLMGKDCGEVDEHSEVDKEKWWDEERRVFRGRVDSFIARMHLVQGDRRFTQWKGSVVDSVVGVFLTQNVSDHLSSSAFMALAANFPLSRHRCSIPNGEKEFLNRLVREHGSIDLEWLRDASPDKVKDYLLSIRGLGLKSAECVRLLTLQQLAFPVDTNVGRICVRLGWVPLQPLPESLQLHLLELYPVLATIQKYLWPRLCKLDQRTLYELHYQMITFGKVFCTKRKPNCNSCPMRGECKHFASAFASARLALPAPEDKSVVSFTTPIASETSHTLFINPTPLPQLEGSSNSQECTFQNTYEPIVEEPASPEPECPEALESAIEDAFYEDPDEIPTISLNLEEFTQNLRNYMEENMELQDGSLSKALVALTPEAASIPMPKLKNVSRLRTEHQVYEIPDTHPLLEGVDPREPDDPSPYLLAIWTPGETAQSTEPPKACCNSQDPDQFCEMSTCFACNSFREAESHKVRGTLLIPCRTAMRGSFPLNGTYFQVNEVFADHHSSCDPIYVPREWIWNLPRRTVYFGTSIPTIFRGLTTEGIQQCFWRGFVCVRGFDRVTKAPKPLYARLHFPASKAPKNRKAAEPKVEK